MKNYRDAQVTVERYQQRILGQAQQSYDLYLRRFREMAAAYPQVLIAQRTLGQVRAEYVRALVELWQSGRAAAGPTRARRARGAGGDSGGAPHHHRGPAVHGDSVTPACARSVPCRA